MGRRSPLAFSRLRIEAVDEEAEHEAQEKDKRQPAAGLQPKDSQAALSFARASFVRASLEHAQRYGMERPPLSGDVAVTPTQAEAMQPPPPLPPGGP